MWTNVVRFLRRIIEGELGETFRNFLCFFIPIAAVGMIGYELNAGTLIVVVIVGLIAFIAFYFYW